MTDRLLFDRFELRPTERQLLCEGEPVRLGARAFDLLLVLVTNRDRLVTKAELLDEVWPGLVVEEANVQVQVSALRKALGPGAIATIPGLGYRLTLATDPKQAVASQAGDAVSSPSSNLPLEVDLPIGRDDDLAAVGDLLDAHRLVTVIGPGGIGKTCLAMAAARSRDGRYPRGVWWVDLAAISSGDQVAPAIAMAANLTLGGGDPIARLVRALSPHSLLLVLDNCEHLSQTVGRLLQAVLEGAAGVHVLVTSQHALKVKQEEVYLLSPLLIPMAGATLEQARARSPAQPAPSPGLEPLAAQPRRANAVAAIGGVRRKLPA